MKLFIKIACLSLFFSSSAFALTIKPVTDNATVSMTIAKTGVTRIGVMGDRIVQAIGDYQGANQNDVYAIQSDNQTGTVFITPEQASPFSLTIKTEQGHYYTLRLNPTASMPDAVMLRPAQKSVRSLVNASALPYLLNITRLMQAMVTDSVPDNYAVMRMSTKPQPFAGRGNLRLVKVWQGDKLMGKIYQVSNGSQAPLHLSEPMFMNGEVLAVGLSERNLPAQHAAWVYEVVRNG